MRVNCLDGDLTLSSDEIRRYSRHLTLPEVGVAGQQRLKAASVLLVGAGGLGSPAALYLAAAGVGRIGLVDFDTVDESNLQRQVLYGTSSVGRRKLDAARDRLRDLNPHIVVETHHVQLAANNAMELVEAYDLVADGTDNFATRYLVNDACVLAGKPNVYASIFRFEGQASVFGVVDGPCYRCVYPDPPPSGLVPSCAEGGVLGVLPGLLGLIQATEVVKLIIDRGQSLVGRLLLVDALAMQFRTLRVRRNPECPLCGISPSIHELRDAEAACRAPDAGAEGGQGITGYAAGPSDVPLITVQELKSQLEAGARPFILDVREPPEYAIANIGGSLIPLRSLGTRLDELAACRTEELIVHCKSGGRSAEAVRILLAAGFRARSLSGGIRAWSSEIDPTVPLY
jgi:adenylyltransferase/sulfurtransferase